jgi:hypothetical protein
MIELLHEHSAQRQAFAEACHWAEEIYLCVSWIEPGDAQGPSFADLKPYEDKIRQAIVGITQYKSYPALLRRLYRTSMLTLVSTTDDSFSPNCYLFRQGSTWRVLIASAPFSSTRVATSYESLVFYEGPRDDAFVLSALRLLDRCRAAAHVPTLAELSAYEDAWAKRRIGMMNAPAVLGMPLESYDTSELGGLSWINDPAMIQESLIQVRESLSTSASMKVLSGITPAQDQGDDAPITTTLFWSPIGMWSALHRVEDGYRLHIGFSPPWEVERSVATLSWTLDSSLQLDSNTEDVMEDRVALAKTNDHRCLLVWTNPQIDETWSDARVEGVARVARVAVLGEVGSSNFIQCLAASAWRISRRRASRILESPL